jgi:hypothetical protein
MRKKDFICILKVTEYLLRIPAFLYGSVPECHGPEHCSQGTFYFKSSQTEVEIHTWWELEIPALAVSATERSPLAW